MVYNFKESKEKDHEGGRPAIYLEFDEQANKYKFLCGTT